MSDNPHAFLCQPLCAWCVEPKDPNLPGSMHPECTFRAVCGSVAHIEGRCSCFVPGSTETDPPGMTKRQAARAAVEARRRRHVTLGPHQ